MASLPPQADGPAELQPEISLTESTGTVPTEAPTGHDPYAAWRHLDYRRYSVAWVLMIVARQMESTAVGYELYHRTGRAMDLGWLGLIQALPVIALAIPAGHLADRVNRRWIVIFNLAVNCLCGLSLALVSLHQAPVALIYVILLVEAMAQATGWPARAALLPQVVPTSLLANAITWNSSIFEIASMVGPGLAGLLIYFSFPKAYATSVILQVFALIQISRLTLRAAPRRNEPVTLKSLMMGITFVRRTPLVLATITLDLFAVLLGGATYLLPIFAKDILHVDKIGFGLLRSAPAAGAVLMALIVAHRPPTRHAGRNLLLAVTGFGVATIVFGLSHWFWLSLLMLFLTGAFDNISVVVRASLVQLLTPDQMRGRVSAVNIVFISASNDLGGFESGATAALMGPVGSVVFGGIGAILVVCGVNQIWPQLRRFGALHEAKPEQA